MVTFTDVARDKVLALMKPEPREKLALRFAIQGRGPGGFQYQLGFVEPNDRRSDDAVVDAGPRSSGPLPSTAYRARPEGKELGHGDRWPAPHA